jgi:thiamine biosynthesis lipoprotein ApbE
VISASVIAADASSAEAWATALLIAGSERGMAGAQERRMPVVLHTEAGQAKVSPAMERFVIQSTYVAVAAA